MKKNRLAQVEKILKAGRNSQSSTAMSLKGDNQIIDGHFKWYTNDGKIWGFAKGDGTFYHNWPSGRHRSDQSYFDYSHGVRLICPN